MENTIYKLEHEIQTLIFQDNNCSTHYDYILNNFDKIKKLKITTYNPRHDTYFLLYTGELESEDNTTDQVQNKINLLKQALEYLKNTTTPNYHLHYTIRWSKKGVDGNFTSYFVGKTIKEIIEKFYDGKNYHDYIVYEIKLGPES